MTEDISADPSLIKKGLNTRAVVTACRCVNVGLFLAGALRRDVEIILAQGTPEDLSTVIFPGHSLKRVSPDERSVSFFLLKAMNRLQDMNRGETQIMNNGIVIKRCTLTDIVQTEREIVIASGEGKYCIEAIKSCKGLFIYDLQGQVHRAMAIYHPIKVTMPPHPERFILDVNTHCDNLLHSAKEKLHNSLIQSAF